MRYVRDRLMQKVTIIGEQKLAFSPRAASAAFDPPCGHRTIREAIATGQLPTHKVGLRIYASAAIKSR